MTPDPKKPEEEDGVLDGAAEAAEDIADDFLDIEPERDPTPGPPRTIKDER